MCKICGDPHARASQFDSGIGDSCTCEAGFGQTFEPQEDIYGDPVPLPIPICTACEIYEGYPAVPANIFGVVSYCNLCSPGHAETRNRDGSVQCKACGVGFWAFPGDTTCTPCAAGTTTPGPGAAFSQAGCTVACSDASVSVVGANYTVGGGGPCLACTPIACPPGFRVEACTPQHNARCVPCGPGTVALTGTLPLVVNSTCEPCYGGCGNTSAFWNAECSGAVDTVCLCAGGYYNATPTVVGSGLECLPCAATQFSTGGAPSYCEPCASGTFSPPGLWGCYTCADSNAVANTAADPGDGRTCTCTAGYAQSGINSSAVSCTLCGAGHYTARLGAAACSACVPGFFLTAAGSVGGATACLPCPPGSFSSAAAASGCTLCSPGAYAPFAGSKACTPCTADSFSEAPGATYCSGCPSGTSVAPGSSNGSLCLAPSPGASQSPIPVLGLANASATPQAGSAQVRGALVFSAGVPVAVYARPQTILDLAAGIANALAAAAAKSTEVKGAGGAWGLQVTVTAITDIATGTSIYGVSAPSPSPRAGAQRLLALTAGSAGVKIDFTVLLPSNSSNAASAVTDLIAPAAASGGVPTVASATASAASAALAQAVVVSVSAAAASSGNSALAAGFVGVTASVAAPTTPYVAPPTRPSQAPAIIGGVFGAIFLALLGYAVDWLVLRPKRVLKAREAEEARTRAEEEEARAEAEWRDLPPVFWGGFEVPKLPRQPAWKAWAARKKTRLAQIVPHDAAGGH